MKLGLLIAPCLLLVFAPGACRALAEEEGRPVEELKADRQVSFEKDILPILRKNCLACHNESETEGELILESVETVLAGGDTGPAVVPGKAEESLLFQVASHRAEPVMPPEDNDVGAKPLSPQQLGLLKLWIDQGAKVGETKAKQEIQWQKVPEKLAPIHAMDVSRDGRWLAAGRGNQVLVYALPAKRSVATLSDPSIAASHPDSAHLDIVQSVAYSPDQHTLVTGGFRCIKVWQRDLSEAKVVSSGPVYPHLPDDVSLADLVDAHVSADQSKLILVRLKEGKAIAQLLSLPDHKVVKEWTSAAFGEDGLRELDRQVGLRKERVRVAKADVEAAKKRKTDDENHVKKTTEELKKANDEVPKKQEARDKAKDAASKKADEIAQAEAELTAAQESVKQLTASSQEAGDEAAKKKAAADKQAAEKKVKDLQASIANKKKELEKAEAEAKKKQLELEGAEKVVSLAKDAKQRAEQMVKRRTTELADAEKEAAGFELAQQGAEEAATKAKEAEQASTRQIVRARFLDGGWELALWDNQGHCARFASEDGALLSVEEVTADGRLAAGWKLIKTLGEAGDESVFADRVTALAFSDDGTLLATGGGAPSRSGEVQLWKTSDWSLVSKIDDVHSDVVYDLTFSPQDSLLASCASDRMVKLVNVEDGKALRTFEGHTGHVLGVAWRADGRTLVTAGADKVVKVWDAKEGTQKKTIAGFKSEVTDVCYLGLEDRFVFGVGTGQVESRDSNGGGKPAFAGFKDYIHRVSASQDGQVVAAAGEDRVIRVWDPKGKLVAEFK